MWLEPSPDIGCLTCQSGGLGATDAPQQCGILLPAIVGAAAVYFLPKILDPIFGGMVEGAKAELSDRREGRGYWAPPKGRRRGR